MTKPINGQIVHFRTRYNERLYEKIGEAPNAAMIVGVHTDRLVNINVFGAYGTVFNIQQIEYVPFGETPVSDQWCEWVSL